MLKTRSTALAIVAILAAGEPSLAATCNMTVMGTSILDDAACAVVRGRGVTEVQVASGGTIDIRRSIMSVRPMEDRSTTRRRRKAPRSYGQVLTSVDPDNKTCYANSKAVLCVEP